MNNQKQLGELFMDLAYDMRQVAEDGLKNIRTRYFQYATSEHYKLNKMLRDADALFEAGVCLIQEG